MRVFMSAVLQHPSLIKGHAGKGDDGALVVDGCVVMIEKHSPGGGKKVQEGRQRRISAYPSRIVILEHGILKSLPILFREYVKKFTVLPEAVLPALIIQGPGISELRPKMGKIRACNQAHRVIICIDGLGHGLDEGVVYLPFGSGLRQTAGGK